MWERHAQAAQQVLGEPSWVLAGLDDLVDHAEHRRPVAGGEGVDDLVEQAVGGVAEQPGGQRVGDTLRAGAAEQLKSALLVNPHDVDQVASTLEAAVEMEPAEIQRRMLQLKRTVKRADVYRWADGCLDPLGA